MSRAGLIAAARYAETLPNFDSLEEAETALYAFRDDRLARFGRIAQASGALEMDYRPDSLKTLERWFFDLEGTDGFDRVGVTSEVFEECVAMYFFEIAAWHAEAEWTVREWFASGRYQIGVTLGWMTVRGLRRRPRKIEQQNKRKQSMWRDYLRQFHSTAR